MLILLGTFCYRSPSAPIFQPSKSASEMWALALHLVVRGEEAGEQEGLVCRSQVEVREKKHLLLSWP